MSRLFALGGNLVAFAAGIGLLARYVSPQVFWPPAIVALFLPVLIIGTLVYVVLQVFRRRYGALFFPVLVLLCALPLLDRLFAWPQSRPEPAEEVPVLNLLTANQRFFHYEDRSDVDTARVSAVFNTYHTQVALLQEVRSTRYRIDYIPEIISATGLSNRHQLENTLIATYADSLSDYTAAFTMPNKYNGYVVSDVYTGIGTLRVINAHLETNRISALARDMRADRSISSYLTVAADMLRGYRNSARIRAAQAAEIREIIDQSPYPVILGGDFNDVPSSYTYQRLLSPRLQDAWAVRGAGLGTTFTGPLPGLRIDYFLVDTSLTVVDIERLSPEWSDHRPLRLTVAR